MLKTCDFLKKLKNIGKMPERAILVTADLVGLYPSIPHEAGLEPLRKRLNERETPREPTEEWIKMADFVLKNNFLNSMGRWKYKNRGPPLVLNLHLLMHFYGCSRSRIPYESVFTTFFCGSVILTTCFLYGLMEKKNSFSFLMNLITSTLIYVLHMKPQRTMLIF